MVAAWSAECKSFFDQDCHSLFRSTFLWLLNVNHYYLWPLTWKRSLWMHTQHVNARQANRWETDSQAVQNRMAKRMNRWWKFYNKWGWTDEWLMNIFEQMNGWWKMQLLHFSRFISLTWCSLWIFSFLGMILYFDVKSLFKLCDAMYYCVGFQCQWRKNRSCTYNMYLANNLFKKLSIQCT